MESDGGKSTSPCDLDRDYSDQISALLSPPDPQSVKDYYDELMETRKCNGIGVMNNGNHGKGVYANKDFKEEELLLKDQILVGGQHTPNKIDCYVCSYCYRFIGSIEIQIGRRLFLQNIGSFAKNECCDDPCSHSKTEVSRELIESLLNGDFKLPFTNQFNLPKAFYCPGGCEEEHYCSQKCADEDWDSYHSLLCTGPNTNPSQSSKLNKFIEHANETNDIFLVAAKAITYTILRYKKLKKRLQNNKKEKQVLDGKIDESNFKLLLEAWKPISMGFKQRWWECVALPDDTDPSDEPEFRMQIRDLAYASLQLLRDAIFDAECAPLFSLEVYAHIISMFELNNLDLVVASPLEDYFMYIDDLPDKEKEEAEAITCPLFHALGDDYSIPCQGTAFYPIQSCMNHSCCPNAKAFKREEDIDGHAIIIALRPITTGEEITISYIDEDLPYEERQSLLADYGFTCTCPKCLEERHN